MTSYEFIWHVANSPLGITLIVGGIGHLLIVIFKAKPTWQKVYDQNKGLFFDAVKFAETFVPPGAPGSGAAKAKAALDYIQNLEHPLAEADKALLIHGIEAAHSAGAAEVGSAPKLDVTLKPES